MERVRRPTLDAEAAAHETETPRLSRGGAILSPGPRWVSELHARGRCGWKTDAGERICRELVLKAHGVQHADTCKVLGRAAPPPPVRWRACSALARCPVHAASIGKCQSRKQSRDRICGAAARPCNTSLAAEQLVLRLCVASSLETPSVRSFPLRSLSPPLGRSRDSLVILSPLAPPSPAPPYVLPRAAPPSVLCALCVSVPLLCSCSACGRCSLLAVSLCVSSSCPLACACVWVCGWRMQRARVTECRVCTHRPDGVWGVGVGAGSRVVLEITRAPQGRGGGSSQSSEPMCLLVFS